jgi:succinate dehydrogenase hydrophobic anchor subunit
MQELFVLEVDHYNNIQGWSILLNIHMSLGAEKMHGMVGMCVLVHNFHAAQVFISDPFIKRGLRLFLQAALTVMKRCT